MPTVSAVKGIVTTQYIQNFGDTVHCSDPPSALGIEWKKLMPKSACCLSAQLHLVIPRNERRTHAYVCPRQEQHAENADPFSGLPITLRSQCDLTCDGSVMLCVRVEGLRFA